MRLPNRVVPGQAVSAEHMNMLIDVVEANELKSGVRYGVRRGRGGTTLDLIPVSAGGGASLTTRGLTLTTSKLPYCPTPPAPVADGLMRVWITLGSCNHTPLKNFANYYDINTNVKFYIKVKLPPSGGVRVTEFEIEEIPYDTAYPPEIVWPVDGSRPEYVYALVGYIIEDTETPGKFNIVQDGQGSFMVYEYNTGVEFNEANPVNGGSAVRYQKELIVIRSEYYNG